MEIKEKEIEEIKKFLTRYKYEYCKWELDCCPSEMDYERCYNCKIFQTDFKIDDHTKGVIKTINLIKKIEKRHIEDAKIRTIFCERKIENEEF